MQRKPELSQIQFAKTEPVQFSASDQTKVHGYITRAAKADSTSIVVLVHGGPHGIRDYWGFDKYYDVSDDNGVSVVLLNSSKGQSFFEKISDKLFSMDTPLEQIIKENPCLVTTVAKGKYSDAFYKKFGKTLIDNMDHLPISRLTELFLEKIFTR